MAVSLGFVVWVSACFSFKYGIFVMSWC